MWSKSLESLACGKGVDLRSDFQEVADSGGMMWPAHTQSIWSAFCRVARGGVAHTKCMCGFSHSPESQHGQGLSDSPPGYQNL